MTCPRRDRDERGAVAIVVSLLMTVLLVITAMVLDFGLVRIDRQVDRAAADEATLAGLHALNTGDGTPHPFVGVCTAARYLKANNQRFSGADENSGWKNGLDAPVANGCADVALRNKTCKPGKDSWAKWSWTGTTGGVTVTVTIESGYDFTATGNQWREDSLGASSGDNGDAAYQGCDNLAVTISQSRDPGLGSLATSSDLSTAIRSVGRIKPIPGGNAPAMLLLKRTGCPVLSTGSNTSPATSFIKVLGAVATDGSGKTQAGTIHADSDGVGCNGSNNSWVFGGRGARGIVAYAAPMATNPLAADPGKPGIISSVAAANGVGATMVRDNLDNVYGSSAIDGTGGTKAEVTGRSLVTRKLVDERYFSGVKAAASSAAGVFASGAAGLPSSGWTNLAATDRCKPTQQEVNAAVASAIANTNGKLYVNCTTNAGFAGTGATLEIGATEVYFAGVVSPAAVLKLPSATKVYVGNHTDRADAITISNNTSLQVNNSLGNLDAASKCNTGQSISKAVLFVRYGTVKQTGGLLQMCRTSAIMLGGQTSSTATAGPGCVPLTAGTAPTQTPCNGGMGNGQFDLSGTATIDWSAPDTLNATTDASGNPTPEAVAAWSNPNGPEDLAMWSESASNDSNTTFSMGGSGQLRVRGVYMVPNAAPFIIGGGGTQILTNAQYVASSIALNGAGTNITMSVDPNSAVTLPDQGLVGLVR
jgi:hypothetical protein